MGLNATGATVWELIDAHRTVADIASQVARDFEVTPERAEGDVIQFLQALEQAGVIRRRRGE